MKTYLLETRGVRHLVIVEATAYGLKNVMNYRLSLSLFEIADVLHIYQLAVIIAVKLLKKVH
jgi:hypothetical protein